jgi:hypothetical protein
VISWPCRHVHAGWSRRPVVSDPFVQTAPLCNTPYPNTGIDHATAQGPQRSDNIKLCHSCWHSCRGNLTEPLYPRTCQTVTLSAPLAGRPHTDVSGLLAAWPDPGSNPRSTGAGGARAAFTSLLAAAKWADCVSERCHVHNPVALTFQRLMFTAALSLNGSLSTFSQR